MKKSNFLIGLILVMVVSTVIAVPGWAAELVVGLVDVIKFSMLILVLRRY